MHPKTEFFPPNQPDQRILQRLFVVDQVCLFATVLLALINLFPRIFGPIRLAMPESLLTMRTGWAWASLCAATGLFCSEATQSRKMLQIGQVLGGITTAIAVTLLAAPGWRIVDILSRKASGAITPSGQSSIAIAGAGFLLAGTAMLLIRSGDTLAGRIADAAATWLSFLVLVLLEEFLFGLMRIPGSSTAGLVSKSVLVCLACLTVVVMTRRAEHGVFSFLVGHGIGGRVARILTPVLLILPFFREVTRARILNTHLIPPRYATALMTSVATTISFVLLLYLVRLINGMQREIQTLNLRDELTGLNSVRGFYLLAEQAFRLARRAKLPFAVIFVDMDNLKIINDELGHSAGSLSLVETGRLLTENFREADVVGRVGGDEFVVAGQFGKRDALAAMERLRAGAARKTNIAGGRFSLSLSMGCAITEDFAGESLKSLVAKADEAMYEEKRTKKNSRSATEPKHGNKKLGAAEQAKV
jgi:diguanylate cyclase (GGDEF)-like protein